MNRRDAVANDCAARQVNFIRTKLIESARLELRVPVDAKRLYMVYIEGFSPLRPLEEQLERMRESGSREAKGKGDADILIEWMKENVDLVSRIIGVLSRTGVGSEATSILSSAQKWECVSVETDEAGLQSRLRKLYKRGDAETDFGYEAIPNGVLIVCRIIPREWQRRHR